MAVTTGLLGLPPELRNRIYNLICASTHTAKLNADGQLCEHPLAATCRHVRKEFLGVWDDLCLMNVKEIEAIVVDFNFGPFRKLLAHWRLFRRSNHIRGERANAKRAGRDGRVSKTH